MKAVVWREPLPAADPRALVDAEIAPPAAPGGHDLLVRIEAVSVNPIDTKMRLQPHAGERILGWDAAGVVEAAGGEATLFRPGDEVYYAGSIARSGSYAQKQLVDERIVGRKPKSLDFAAAAALPLTTLTAYEAIVHRLRVPEGKTLLVIGGAGGVGSMAIQIGKRLGIQVIATASRPESSRWCRELGAAHVISHAEPLRQGLLAHGMEYADYILNCADTDQYWLEMAEAIAPQGGICSIVANARPVDVQALRAKCAWFAWEGMFARSTWKTPDLVEQHRLLCRVADWIDAGEVRGTMQEQLRPINAANLRKAHQKIEGRATIGKIVLGGW
ncbi:MAG TPA: zinc-binding alcohol dehydrogenase family protein [Burkholderiales bacterium]|nr:zinc-binding alcohol dehydrogenase family protein [Burkholderiales bacterium]